MKKDKDFESDEAWEDFLRYNDIFGMAMKIEMLTKYSTAIHYYSGDKNLRVEIIEILPEWPWIEYISTFDFNPRDKERADETEENLAMLLRRTLEEEGEF